MSSNGLLTLLLIVASVPAVRSQAQRLTKCYPDYSTCLLKEIMSDYRYHYAKCALLCLISGIDGEENMEIVVCKKLGEADCPYGCYCRRRREVQPVREPPAEQTWNTWPGPR